MERIWPTITRHRSLNPVSVLDIYLSSGSAVKQLEDCTLGSSCSQLTWHSGGGDYSGILSMSLKGAVGPKESW